MDEIVIEKGMPIPPMQKRTTKGSVLSVFKKMDIGDSFEISSEFDFPKIKRNIRANVVYATKVLGHKYTTRTFDNKKIRVWRIT